MEMVLDLFLVHLESMMERRLLCFVDMSPFSTSPHSGFSHSSPNQCDGHTAVVVQTSRIELCNFIFQSVDGIPNPKMKIKKAISGMQETEHVSCLIVLWTDIYAPKERELSMDSYLPEFKCNF